MPRMPSMINSVVMKNKFKMYLSYILFFSIGAFVSAYGYEVNVGKIALSAGIVDAEKILKNIEIMKAGDINKAIDIQKSYLEIALIQINGSASESDEVEINLNELRERIKIALSP